MLGHIGARGTAYWNVRLLDKLFDFDEIRVHSRRPESRDDFARRLSEDLGKPVRAPTTGSSACEGADIVVEASRLPKPDAAAQDRLDQEGRAGRALRHHERGRALAHRHHGQDGRRRLGPVPQGRPVRRAARPRGQAGAERDRRCMRSWARSWRAEARPRARRRDRSCSGTADCRQTDMALGAALLEKAKRASIGQALRFAASGLVTSFRMYSAGAGRGAGAWRGCCLARVRGFRAGHQHHRQYLAQPSTNSGGTRSCAVRSCAGGRSRTRFSDEGDALHRCRHRRATKACRAIAASLVREDSGRRRSKTPSAAGSAGWRRSAVGVQRAARLASMASPQHPVLYRGEGPAQRRQRRSMPCMRAKSTSSRSTAGWDLCRRHALGADGRPRGASATTPWTPILPPGSRIRRGCVSRWRHCDGT